MGTFKHAWGIGKALNAPSWITIPSSIFTSLNFCLANETTTTHAPNHAFFMTPSSSHAPDVDEEQFNSTYIHWNKYLDDDYTNAPLNLCPLLAKMPSGWGSLPKVGWGPYGSCTRSPCGNIQNKKQRIVEFVVVKATIWHEAPMTHMSMRCMFYVFYCILILNYIDISQDIHASICLAFRNNTLSGTCSYRLFWNYVLLDASMGEWQLLILAHV